MATTQVEASAVLPNNMAVLQRRAPETPPSSSSVSAPEVQRAFTLEWRVPKPLIEMAAASTAMVVSAVLFNPQDVVKTKLQTQHQLTQGGQASGKLYHSCRHCFRTLLSEQGFFEGLWRPGITAAVLRDSVNGGVRMGLYPKFVKTIDDSAAALGIPLPSLAVKILAGWSTGMIGAFAGNPTDLVKVRMQAESGRIERGVYVTGLYKGSPPSYSSATRAVLHIAKHEGIPGLWRGCSANAARAALVTSGQMASYDQTKTVLAQLSSKDGMLGKLFGYEPVRVATASFISGVVAASVAAPADLVRSRVMNDSRGGRHQALYSGSMNCVVQTVRHEGFFALWQGWVPAYLRLGPQFMIGFPLMEIVRRYVFGLPAF